MKGRPTIAIGFGRTKSQLVCEPTMCLEFRLVYLTVVDL